MYIMATKKLFKYFYNINMYNNFMTYFFFFYNYNYYYIYYHSLKVMRHGNMFLWNYMIYLSFFKLHITLCFNTFLTKKLTFNCEYLLRLLGYTFSLFYNMGLEMLNNRLNKSSYIYKFNFMTNIFMSSLAKSAIMIFKFIKYMYIYNILNKFLFFYLTLMFNISSTMLFTNKLSSLAMALNYRRLSWVIYFFVYFSYFKQFMLMSSNDKIYDR